MKPEILEGLEEACLKAGGKPSPSPKKDVLLCFVDSLDQLKESILNALPILSDPNSEFAYYPTIKKEKEHFMIKIDSYRNRFPIEITSRKRKPIDVPPFKVRIFQELIDEVKGGTLLFEMGNMRCSIDSEIYDRDRDQYVSWSEIDASCLIRMSKYPSAEERREILEALPEYIDGLDMEIKAVEKEVDLLIDKFLRPGKTKKVGHKSYILY
ncbi:MAG: hypothetical protein DRN78_03585 [Thermoproteota archaeon]|nr:MAG: hypothetical protein DRN78_03585 [Candidatus Korarchaeota archaeon]